MSAALHLAGTIGLGHGTVPLEAAFRLLDALAGEKSLQGAARRLGISYRCAWGRIGTIEAACGQAVAVKTKGHGSLLTPFGSALLAAIADAYAETEAALEEARLRLDRRLGALAAPLAAPLRLAASHDTLLTGVLAGRPDIETSVAGSAEALAKLAAGSVDAAGFHFGAREARPDSPFAALFADPDRRIVPLFLREQGLMLARGNPLGLSGIADIAATGARFVNRQRGAGTRLWFERLCREAAVPAEAIRGIETEEFTHQAVAAIIASGAADVGMGTRAVAARFGLGFLPLGEETYFLATRAGFEHPALAPLVEAVRERAGDELGYGPA
ncbi:molybdate transport repressor ModE-like protein [Methylobacterium sp. BE186]|uniref:helix-turn-helix transcriptional regulator n=1 Tax=Methylobacterium sp. BE186 TaxID=2817715 RepID=UPI00285C0275|nr:helix-turn-helix transcriptional regulator [Methylobacterium sp. BE186]MDR7037916.1 molybdate transport repressor ModE-like protein [Methylobacterium sp. BE186]